MAQVRGGSSADSTFSDVLSQSDVGLATRLLRSAVLETTSGRYHSSALRSSLYGEYLVKLLDRVFGEHSDYAAPPATTCWWDAVDGVRLMRFREARDANDKGFLAAMSPVEIARCQAALDLQDLLMPMPPSLPAAGGAGQQGRGAIVPALSAGVAAPPAPLRDSLYYDQTVRTFALRRELLPAPTQKLLEAMGGTALPLSPQLEAVDPLLHLLLRTRAPGGPHSALGPLLPPQGAGTVASRSSLPVTRDELLLLYTLRFPASTTRKYGFQQAPEGFVAEVAHLLSAGTHVITHPHEAVLGWGGGGGYGGGVGGALHHLASMHSFQHQLGLLMPFAGRPLLYTYVSGLANNHAYLDHLFTITDEFLARPDYPPSCHPLAPLFAAGISSYWLLHNAPALLPLAPAAATSAGASALGVPTTASEAAAAAASLRGGQGDSLNATMDGRTRRLTGGLGGTPGRLGSGARALTAALGVSGALGSPGPSSSWAIPGLDTAAEDGAGADAGGDAGSGRFGPTGVGLVAASAVGGAPRAAVAAAASAAGPSPVRAEYSPPLPSTLCALHVVMVLQLSDGRTLEWVSGRGPCPYPGGPAVKEAAASGARELEAAGLRISDAVASQVGLRPDAQAPGAATSVYGAFGGGLAASRARFGTAPPAPAPLRGPSHLPPLWAGLQHGLFTFLRLHLELLLPVALANAAASPSLHMPAVTTGGLLVGVASYLPTLTHPVTYGAVVDTWIAVLAPWTARQRLKDTLAPPKEASRCFDYAGAALEALRAAAASSDGASGPPPSLEALAASVRASPAFRAALLANATFSPKAASTAAATGGGSSGSSSASDGGSVHTPAAADLRDWVHWLPLHYGFYGHCLQRFMRALAGTSTARVPLAAGASQGFLGSSAIGIPTGFGVVRAQAPAMTAGSPGADFSDSRLDRPYALEALERLLDVLEPPVVAALKATSDVAGGLLSSSRPGAAGADGTDEQHSRLFEASFIGGGSHEQQQQPGGLGATAAPPHPELDGARLIDPATARAQLLTHLSLLKLPAQCATSSARATAAATSAAVASVLVPWAALRSDAAQLVKRLEVALDAAPQPAVPRELRERLASSGAAAAAPGAGGSPPRVAAGQIASTVTHAAATAVGLPHGLVHHHGAAPTVRHPHTGKDVASPERIQFVIDRLTHVFDLPQRVPLVLRKAAAAAAASSSEAARASAGVTGTAGGGFLGGIFSAAALKRFARSSLVSVGCYVTGLVPARAAAMAPDALAPQTSPSAQPAALDASRVAQPSMATTLRRRPAAGAAGMAASGAGMSLLLSPAGKAALLTGRARQTAAANASAYRVPYSLRPPGPYESVFVLEWAAWASAATLSALHNGLGAKLGLGWFDYTGSDQCDAAAPSTAAPQVGSPGQAASLGSVARRLSLSGLGDSLGPGARPQLHPAKSAGDETAVGSAPNFLRPLSDVRTLALLTLLALAWLASHVGLKPAMAIIAIIYVAAGAHWRLVTRPSLRT